MSEDGGMTELSDPAVREFLATQAAPAHVAPAGYALVPIDVLADVRDILWQLPYGQVGAVCVALADGTIFPPEE